MTSFWNATPLIDAHSVEKHSCQISSWSDLKWWSFEFFEEVACDMWRYINLFWLIDWLNKNNNKMSSYMRSVPDLKSSTDHVAAVVVCKCKQDNWDAVTKTYFTFSNVTCYYKDIFHIQQCYMLLPSRSLMRWRLRRRSMQATSAFKSM